MILTKSKNKKLNINNEIERRISCGEISKLLSIVPTNRKARHLKKEIITNSLGNSTQNIYIETISTFSTKIVERNDKFNNSELSEPATYILLEQAINEIDPEYFSTYKNNIPTGTLQQIKNVISEYKKHGITPEILRNEIYELTGSEKLKAKNIADIYEIYQKKLEQLQIKEIGDIYTKFVELSLEEIKKRFSDLFPEVNLIAAIGFDEFTLPEIKIWDKCSKISNTDLYIHFDYKSKNNSIFSHLNNTYSKLIESRFEIIKEKTDNSSNEFESFIQQKLFLSKSVTKNQKFKNSISLLSALNVEEEVEIISKEIKDLITNKGVQPSSICVAFNLIQKYSPIIRDIFSVYGIPYNLTDRFSLSSSSPVISIINILEILENDFYYKDILRGLNSGYLAELDINSTSILKTATHLKIISGLSNWISTLEDEIYLRKNNDENEFEDLLSIETISDTLLAIKKLGDILNPFFNDMTLDEFKQKLIEFIYKLKIPVLLTTDNNFTAEKNIKSVTIFIELLEELTDLFLKQYRVKDKFSLKFYLNFIRTAVKTTRYNIKEKPNYGVLVTSINEIRGLKFDFLFLSGLCDGDFPTRYQPEIFFSGSYFKKENQHQEKERYQFYQALCRWNKKLYLTYPLTDDKREFVKSTFITELESILELTKLNTEDYKNKIYSKEELLVKYSELKGKKYLRYNLTDLDVDSIENSIKIDKMRKEYPFSFSANNGFIGSEINKEAKIKLSKFNERQFSYSQLETYAKCPYKYFAERVLKIEPNDEPTDELEFHELGTLLHLILYEFYTKLLKEKIVLSGCTNEEFNIAKKMIFKIAEDKIFEAHFNSPLTFFEKERILGIEGKKENSILFKFLLTERDNDDGFTPAFFETGFGNFGNGNNKEPILNELKIGEIRIRGKIDRIDLNENDEKFKVVDYKLSGNKPTSTNLQKGIALQIPLYLYAAKELIKAQLKKDSKPISGEIYSLKYRDKKFGKDIVKPINKKLDEDQLVDENKKLIADCVINVEKYVQQITEGKFNLSTLSNRESVICLYCGFKSVCRIQDIT